MHLFTWCRLRKRLKTLEKNEHAEHLLSNFPLKRANIGKTGAIEAKFATSANVGGRSEKLKKTAVEGGDAEVSIPSTAQS